MKEIIIISKQKCRVFLGRQLYIYSEGETIHKSLCTGSSVYTFYSIKMISHYDDIYNVALHSLGHYTHCYSANNVKINSKEK